MKQMTIMCSVLSEIKGDELAPPPSHLVGQVPATAPVTHLDEEPVVELTNVCEAFAGVEQRDKRTASLLFLSSVGKEMLIAQKQEEQLSVNEMLCMLTCVTQLLIDSSSVRNDMRTYL